VRFHLIDKVDEYEPGQSIRARKLTSWSEDYWEQLDGGPPTMPITFPLEALCQAATWLIMITTERSKRAALLSIGSVDFFEPVHPGDILVMEGRMDSMGDETGVVSGTVTTEDGRKVLDAADIMCALIPAESLADLDDTERLQLMLTREGGGLTG
jgi:3-hydroxyacyl-[acyl-carrier-protein] dehydratase